MAWTDNSRNWATIAAGMPCWGNGQDHDYLRALVEAVVERYYAIENAEDFTSMLSWLAQTGAATDGGMAVTGNVKHNVVSFVQRYTDRLLGYENQTAYDTATPDFTLRGGFVDPADEPSWAGGTSTPTFLDEPAIMADIGGSRIHYGYDIGTDGNCVVITDAWITQQYEILRRLVWACHVEGQSSGFSPGGWTSQEQKYVLDTTAPYTAPWPASWTSTGSGAPQVYGKTNGSSYAEKERIRAKIADIGGTQVNGGNRDVDIYGLTQAGEVWHAQGSGWSEAVYQIIDQYQLTTPTPAVVNWVGDGGDPAMPATDGNEYGWDKPINLFSINKYDISGGFEYQGS